MLTWTYVAAEIVSIRISLRFWAFQCTEPQRKVKSSYSTYALWQNNANRWNQGNLPLSLVFTTCKVWVPQSLKISVEVLLLWLPHRRLFAKRSGCSVVDNTPNYQYRVDKSIPCFSGLLDETLNQGPVSIWPCWWDVKSEFTRSLFTKMEVVYQMPTVNPSGLNLGFLWWPRKLLHTDSI